MIRKYYDVGTLVIRYERSADRQTRAGFSRWPYPNGSLAINQFGDGIDRGGKVQRAAAILRGRF
jgi:hypothetical protein